VACGFSVWGQRLLARLRIEIPQPVVKTYLMRR
jgi:hypothetical protein